MKATSGDSSVAEQLSFQITDGGSIPTSPLQLFVRPISHRTALLCYCDWHYLGDTEFLGTHNFGAYFDGLIRGAMSFHQPSAVETVMGLWGIEDQRGIFEIGRLAMSPDCPKNSESRFIGVAIRLLRKATDVRAIITYADSGVGHVGTIYKASGFTYKGLTAPKSDFWVNGRKQERGKTKGVEGEWRPRSRKHLYIKVFDSALAIAEKGERP